MRGNSLQNWAVALPYFPLDEEDSTIHVFLRGVSGSIVDRKFIITKFIIIYNNESTEISHPNLSFLLAGQIVKRSAPFNDEKSVPKGPF